MRIVLLIVLCLGAYLLGGFSTGRWLVSRQKGVDIRAFGSGSSGATNVLRVMGKNAGLITFAGDFLKGIIAALAGVIFADALQMSPKLAACVIGFCAIFGNVFPVMAGFKGGKGVATAAGTFVVISIGACFLAIAATILCIVLTRFVSLGSLLGGVVFWVFGGIPNLIRGQGFIFAFATCVMALVFFSHRDNIKRLLAGKENVIDLAAFSAKK
ncbi:glycerol-3-phosphate acyltransferase [Clostridia bacterium]|nr:glycerol-3-phosphate acyltransferase [Clostridia bacterium]